MGNGLLEELGLDRRPLTIDKLGLSQVEPPEFAFIDAGTTD